MHPVIDSLLIGWNHNLGYARRLIDDLSDEQMLMQPHPGMNHAAWNLRHLGAYHPLLTGLLRGELPDDPREHRFGMQSKPEPDAALYGPKAGIIADFEAGHDTVADALRSADDAVFAAAMPVERFRERFTTVGSCLGYIMLAHEGMHLGQISMWRRAAGLGSV